MFPCLRGLLWLGSHVPTVARQRRCRGSEQLSSIWQSQPRYGTFFFPQEYGSDGKENEIKEQEHGVDITTRIFLLWRYSPLRRVVRLPYTGSQELAFYWGGGGASSRVVFAGISFAALGPQNAQLGRQVLTAAVALHGEMVMVQYNAVSIIQALCSITGIVVGNTGCMFQNCRYVHNQLTTKMQKSGTFRLIVGFVTCTTRVLSSPLEGNTKFARGNHVPS